MSKKKDITSGLVQKPGVIIDVKLNDKPKPLKVPKDLVQKPGQIIKK